MIDKSLWTPRHIAWAGGLLEGEASFNITSNKIRAEIRMTDQDVIESLHKIAGFGSVTIYNHSKKRDGSPAKKAWTWVGYGRDAYEFELEVFPYLFVRRQNQILESHRKRMEYEIASPGNRLDRIFTDSSQRLLPNAIELCSRLGRNRDVQGSAELS